MNKSVCENSIPKCIIVSPQKNPEEDGIFKPKNRNSPLTPVNVRNILIKNIYMQKNIIKSNK